MANRLSADIPLLERYRASMKVEQMSDETISQYTGNLNRIDSFVSLRYNKSIYNNYTEVTKEHLIAYISTISHLSAPTINTYIWALRSFYNYLIEIKAVSSDENPARSLRIHVDRRDPREKTERFYNEEEVRAFLDAFAMSKRRYWKRDLAIVAMILGSGLRASEVCSLTVQDFIDYTESGSLVCKRKGGKPVEVQVARFAQQYVDDYLETRDDYSAHEPLFLSQKGGALGRKALWSTFAGYQFSAGVSTGIHVLRHCFLTAIKNDTDIFTAAAAGNHKSIKTTMHYDHTNSVRDAVNGSIFAKMLSQSV